MYTRQHPQPYYVFKDFIFNYGYVCISVCQYYVCMWMHVASETRCVGSLWSSQYRCGEQHLGPLETQNAHLTVADPPLQSQPLSFIVDFIEK